MGTAGCIYTVVVRREDGAWVTLRTTNKHEAERWRKGFGI